MSNQHVSNTVVEMRAFMYFCKHTGDFRPQHLLRVEMLNVPSLACKQNGKVLKGKQTCRWETGEKTQSSLKKRVNV